MESALIALALIVTLIAALDLGQFLFFHQAFRERVRAAVRHAVVHQYNPDSIRNFVLFNSPESRDGPALLGLTASAIAVARYDEGTPRDRIEVRIENFPLRMFTPWLSRGALRPVFRSVEPIESLGATE